MKIYFINGIVPCIVVQTQKELDSIPASWEGTIEVRFGHETNPCIITQDRTYIIRGNSYVAVYNNAVAIARDNVHVEAFENAHIEAYNNAYVAVADDATVYCYHSSVIEAFNNAFVHNMGTCGKVIMHNGWEDAAEHHISHTDKPCDIIGKVMYLEDRYGAPHLSQLWWCK